MSIYVSPSLYIHILIYTYSFRFLQSSPFIPPFTTTLLVGSAPRIVGNINICIRAKHFSPFQCFFLMMPGCSMAPCRACGFSYHPCNTQGVCTPREGSTSPNYKTECQTGNNKISGYQKARQQLNRLSNLKILFKIKWIFQIKQQNLTSKQCYFHIYACVVGSTLRENMLWSVYNHPDSSFL